MSRYVVEHKQYSAHFAGVDITKHIHYAVMRRSLVLINDAHHAVSYPIASFDDQDTADRVCRDLNRERKV